MKPWAGGPTHPPSPVSAQKSIHSSLLPATCSNVKPSPSRGGPLPPPGGPTPVAACTYHHHSQGCTPQLYIAALVGCASCSLLQGVFLGPTDLHGAHVKAAQEQLEGDDEAKDGAVHVGGGAAVPREHGQEVRLLLVLCMLRLPVPIIHNLRRSKTCTCSKIPL